MAFYAEVYFLKAADVLGRIRVEAGQFTGRGKLEDGIAIGSDDLSRLGVPDHDTIDFARCLRGTRIPGARLLHIPPDLRPLRRRGVSGPHG